MAILKPSMLLHPLWWWHQHGQVLRLSLCSNLHSAWCNSSPETWRSLPVTHAASGCTALHNQGQQQWPVAHCSTRTCSATVGRALPCHVSCLEPHQSAWMIAGLRWHSKTATDPAPDLKSALRMLYKRVHPDMFSDDAVAKAENERSFKLLQDYLHIARSKVSGGRDTPAGRVVYRFAFYLREQPTPAATEQPTAEVGGHINDSAVRQAASEHTTGGACSATPSSSDAVRNSSTDAQASGPQHQRVESSGSLFYRVELSLPPPSPPVVTASTPDQENSTYDVSSDSQAAGKPRQRLAGSVRRALTKLFQACGVEVVPGLGELPPGSVDDAHDDNVQDNTTLATFLPAAMEAQRLAKASNSEPAVRAANIRGAFRLQRKLLVSFQDPASVPPTEQVTHLTQLASLLDSLPHVHLEGCAIVLGQGLGVDKLGRLLLDIRAGVGGPDSWGPLLEGVDMAWLREQQQYVQAVKSLEQRVAARVGLRSVFAALPASVAEPEYRQFLERLAAAATTHGEAGGGSFNDMSLCVQTAYAYHAHQQQQHKEQEWQQHTNAGAEEARASQQTAKGVDLAGGQPGGRVDWDLAVLVVPDSLRADQVYQAVSQLGPQVQQAMRIKSAKQEATTALVTRVRTALHLRHFTKDDRLADHHFQAACKRLLEQSDALRHVTDGGSVRIGFANRVWPDGSYVEIAHDFAF